VQINTGLFLFIVIAVSNMPAIVTQNPSEISKHQQRGKIGYGNLIAVSVCLFKKNLFK